VKRACFQLIFWVANYRKCAAEIERLMAAFATRCIERHGHASLSAIGLHFSDKFVSSHGAIIGRKRPSMQQVFVGEFSLAGADLLLEDLACASGVRCQQNIRGQTLARVGWVKPIKKVEPR
jgi:hypothetical protein